MIFRTVATASLLGTAVALSRGVNVNKEAIGFESFELIRERVVQPGQEIVVYLPALDPGTYPSFDDFHHSSGQGAITAR